MPLSRRSAFALSLAAATSAVVAGMPAASALTGESGTVEKAVEAMRAAMLAADAKKLKALVSDQLSYGHSSGKTETKAEFVDVIASKKTIYKSIDLKDQTVSVNGATATVRHTFVGNVEAGGKPISVKIGVLQVWRKEGRAWRLFARQGFTLPA